jgi:hypothetical protein
MHRNIKLRERKTKIAYILLFFYGAKIMRFSFMASFILRYVSKYSSIGNRMIFMVKSAVRKIIIKFIIM